MYYVTHYIEYPIYEPAEGGYYYAGTRMVQSRAFQTWRKAKRHLRKLYKECLSDYKEMEKWNHDLRGWYENPQHTYFGYSTKYVGQDEYIRLERKQGENVRGRVPYC